jgi:cholesterol oxidase
MKRNLWDPSERLYGLFNIWSFSGLGSIVSSGLGGGSLIYANVLLRKDERWFIREDALTGACSPWPITREDLETHYDRVEKMMGVQTYPVAHKPYSETPKTRAFAAAAAANNLHWCLPPLAVTFGNRGSDPLPAEPIIEPHPHLHEVFDGRPYTRYTCRLCGECDIGCNYGSKNTLDFTYLSEALRAGADIRPLHEVKSFEPHGDGGYAIHYVRHDPAGDPAGPPPAMHTMTADRLILSAGTYGSTFLLLKNRSAFPQVSDRLGTQYSDNGDLLTFAFKCREDVQGGPIPRLIDAGRGPVITSTIRVDDEADGGTGRGYYIQDAGYPEFVNWILEVLDVPTHLERWWRLGRELLPQVLRGRGTIDLASDISGLFGSCELSAGLLPLLGMGRDVPNGRMTLRGGLLDVGWKLGPSQTYFDAVRATMERLATSIGGTFLDDPVWYLSRVITVHPLGGCPMGRHPGEGVVDPWGQVFNYPGFYIADGSVMPSPVGANPSLTIAAFADRCADGIIERRGS